MNPPHLSAVLITPPPADSVAVPCGVCMLSSCLARYSGFLTESKDIHAMLTGHSKLAAGVSVNGCLSLCVSSVTHL